jgi:diguanylate cyclase (GGDEF)-like protein
MEPINLSLDNVFLYSQVEKLATCDSMTGLLNHQNIREKLLDAIKIARRQNSPVHVIACDIDKFKNFNDTHGHAAGDKVIKAFAKILGRSRRTGEEAGRPGGEEFLVVLANADRQSAEAAAERILKEVRAAAVPIDGGGSVTFRVSLGIAGIPSDASSLDELLDKADRALYVAKSRGRDRLVLWDKTIDEEYGRART